MANKLSILEKKMDRRSFLRYMGSLLLAVIGVTNLLRILGKHNAQHIGQGYGGGVYGGNKKLLG